MDANRRFADRDRQFGPTGRIPALLLLRSAIGLLLLLVLATGAAALDPPVDASDVPPIAAVAQPAKHTPDTPASRVPTRRTRSVFVCDDAGIPIYSDRPCGPDLVRRSIRVDNPGAGRVASTAPSAPTASTRPRTRNPDRGSVPDHSVERCATLRRQLDDLDDRMRAGYSSREAAKLWDRRRSLKDDLRTTGC